MEVRNYGGKLVLKEQEREYNVISGISRANRMKIKTRQTRHLFATHRFR